MRLKPTCTLLAMAASPLAPLMAMDSFTVGPRALGMGGAGTAVSDDHTAQFYNPAMFGFFSRSGEDGAKLAADPNSIGRKDWGLGIVDLTGEVELHGRLADYTERLSGVDIARLSNLGTGSVQQDDLKTVMTAVAMLGRFAPDKDTVLFRANAGVLDLRVLHVGIGFRQFAEGVVSLADLDRTNVGFGTQTVLNVAQDINQVSPSGWTAGYTPSLITGTAATNVLNAFAAAGAGALAAQEALSKLDYAANQAGLTQADIDALAATGGLLIDAIAGSGLNASTSIENNTTAAFTAGYTVAELPITFGYAINDNISVGGNAKLMVGRVAAAKVRLLSDTSDISQLMKDSIKDGTQTVTAGVDLGLAVRGGFWQLGLDARNLNSPVLKGGTFTDNDGKSFRVDDVTLDPQVRVGAALFPFETLCLTADLDVTRNTTTIATTSDRTDLAPGTPRTLKVEYSSQMASAGIEWNAFRFLALRAGVSRDLAESEVGPVVHAGFGVNCWLMRLDIGAAASTETTTVDGKDYPRSVSLSAGLAMDF